MNKDKKIKQEFSKKALQALAQGKLNKLDLEVKRAINYDDPQTLMTLGETLIESGHLVPAELIFQHLIKIEPQNNGAKIMLADILNENGKTDDALLLLDDVPDDDDNILSALTQKADIYQTLGMPEVSESFLKRALQIAPQQRALIFGMAELLYSESKYAAALKYYEQLIKKGVTDFLNQNLLVRKANCLSFLGQYEQASSIYNKFNDIVLRDDDLFMKGSVSFELKNYQKSIDSLEVLCQRTPDYARAYLILAQDYEKKEQFVKAYNFAQKGCEIDNFDLPLLIKFSQLALKVGHEYQAISGFKKVLKSDPDNIIALIYLSNLGLKNNDYNSVVKLLNKKETLAPQLSWNLGLAFLNMNQLNLAAENLLSCFNDLRNNPSYLSDLIELFQKLNQPKELLSIMQLYLKLVPTDDKIALAYENLRNELDLNG